MSIPDIVEVDVDHEVRGVGGSLSGFRDISDDGISGISLQGLVLHDVLILHQSNGLPVELPLAHALFLVPHLVVFLAVPPEEVANTLLIIFKAYIVDPVPEHVGG